MRVLRKVINDKSPVSAAEATKKFTGRFPSGYTAPVETLGGRTQRHSFQGISPMSRQERISAANKPKPHKSGKNKKRRASTVLGGHI